MLLESQTSTQVFLKFKTTQLGMTLISPSPYLKTIIKFETSHSIQHTHKKILLLILIALT